MMLILPVGAMVLRAALRSLMPDDAWDYFCLDGVSYHGKTVTVVWDRAGDRYGKGSGLHVFADGALVASSPVLRAISGEIHRSSDSGSL